MRYKPFPIRLLSLFSFTLLIIHATAQPVELKIQNGHLGDVNSMVYSHDGRFLASGADDFTAKLWDVATGREVRNYQHTAKVILVALSGDNHILVSATEDNNIFVWETISGKLLRKIARDTWASSLEISEDGKYLLAAGKITTVWELKTGKIKKEFPQLSAPAVFQSANSIIAANQEHTLVLLNFINGKTIKEFTGHNAAITAIDFTRDTQYLASVDSDAKLKVWYLPGGYCKQTVTLEKAAIDVYFRNNGDDVLYRSAGSTVMEHNVESQTSKVFYSGMRNIRTLVFSNDEKYYGISFYNYFWVCNADTQQQGQDFEGISSAIYDATFSKDGKFSFQTHQDRMITIWETASGKQVKKVKSTESEIKKIAVDNSGAFLAGASKRKVILWTLDSGKHLRTLHASDQILDVKFSKDSKFVVASADDNTISVWNIASGDEIRKFAEHQASVACLAMHPDGKRIASASHDSSVKLWHLDNSSSFMTVDAHQGSVLAVEFSPDGSVFVTGGEDRKLKVWETKTGNLLKSVDTGSEVRKLAFSSDGLQIASASKDTIKIWNVEDGLALMQKISDPNGEITALAFDPTGPRILSTNLNNIATLWDVASAKPIVHQLSLENNNEKKCEYVTFTPDNYYTSSRTSNKAIHFVKGTDVYPYEQFDFLFNRPDIIMTRLGKTNKEEIELHHKAYKKRLKTANVTEGMFGDGYHMPRVTMLAEVPVSAESGYFELAVRFTDSLYKLKSYNVYVNNTPVYGSGGKFILDLKTHELDVNIPVYLSYQDNTIEVSVTNENNATSPRKTFKCYNGQYKLGAKDNLYVLTIGISDFDNNTFDLDYAAKDAKDVADAVAGHERFEQVHVKTLLDKEATKENIMEAKAFLKAAGRDDRIIVFIASHGLLDKEFNYYIATPDTDFEQPAKRALSYEDLEDLLNDLICRHKILLIDACNSGEVDEEQMVIADNSTTTPELKSRGFKNMTSSGPTGSKNPFDLMHELFPDVRNGTGTVVISSATGAQVAFESHEWQNGVFSYVVKDALRWKHIDNDLYLKVSRFSEYIIESVEKLTKGKQTPTLRKESRDYDFYIW